MVLLLTVVLLALNLAVNCQSQEDAENLEEKHNDQSQNSE